MSEAPVVPTFAARSPHCELLIVIVCYRAVDLTIDCLRSLVPEVAELPGVRVAICENGSGPEAESDLAAAIEREGWKDWASLSAISPNRGFAGGNDAVLRDVLAGPAPPELFLLLNSDTIVRPGALRALLDAATTHPEAGIIGPRLEWLDGESQRSCFRDAGPLDEFVAAAATGAVSRVLGRDSVALPVQDEPGLAENVSFACALIRRDVFEQIGLLDENYYLYFDDVDFCWRARKAGWKVLYWPASRVVHLMGRSNPMESLAAQRKPRPGYYYESRARYFAKRGGRLHLWLANLAWWAGRTISWSRETILRTPPAVCEREWRDIWTHWRDPLQPPTNRQS